MLNDPFSDLRSAVLQRVLDGSADSAPALRKAAYAATDLPPDLLTLVGKIHAHAYQVTDADVARAQAAYGDDRLFEIIVSAALGASEKRLQAGLHALSDA